MKKRIISAAIILAIIIPLIILGSWPFALAVGVVSILAYREIMELNKYPLIVKLLGFIALILLVYGNFQYENLVLGLNFKLFGMVILLLFIPVIFYQVAGKYTTDDAFKLLGFILLVGLGLNYLIIIRSLDIKYLLFVLLLPILTDTFAYAGGMLIGKHKVTKLSPKKSWEGYIIGSLMGTFMMSMYYVTFINNQTNLLIIISIILLLTIVGQIGDLFFSAIKRQCNIKDFSNLIPGHGGMLDRLDSVIFVVITFMIFIQYL